MAKGAGGRGNGKGEKTFNKPKPSAPFKGKVTSAPSKQPSAQPSEKAEQQPPAIMEPKPPGGDARIRRDSLGSARRALENKLSHISPERLESLTNKNGDRPVDLVSREMASNRHSNPHQILNNN